MSVPSVCLVVLDGWGLAPEGPGNAVALADTPVMDRIWAEHPHTTLTACGEAVGPPIVAPFGYSAALSTSRSSCSFQER